MNIGILLQACRERAGLSQEEIAHTLHKTQSCISKLEHNKKSLDVQTFLDWVRITQAQEVTVAFLYGMDGINMIQNLLPFIGG